MFLSSFYAFQFCNYKELDVKNLKQLNILIGDNTSGKTNFLEIIHTLTTGKGMKKTNSENVMFGKNAFLISGNIDQNKIYFGFQNNTQKIKLNDKVITREELLQNTLSIAFLPEDLDFIQGNPSQKRAFLDTTLSRIDIEYRDAWKKYNHCLKIRNALLREKKINTSSIDPLFINSGSILIEKRKKFVKDLSQYIKPLFQEYYKENIVLEYGSTVLLKGNIKENFKQKLKELTFLETKRHFTMLGPHRDTYDFQKKNLIENFHKSLTFSSQGEIRTLSLLLNFAYALILKKHKKNAILLLDDVFLELDQKRRNLFLQKIIDENFQVFLTSNSLDFFKPFLSQANILTTERQNEPKHL